MTMQAQLTDLLKRHTPIDDVESTHRDNMLAFVEATERCASRETLAGHITASAWILSPDFKSVLLTHHKKLGRWLQLGGHVDDDDASIQDAALREAREESGIDRISLISNEVFDVDVHAIPGRNDVPEHLHYDVRFFFQAATKAFSVSEESHGLAWVELASIRQTVTDGSILRMVKKTRLP